MSIRKDAFVDIDLSLIYRAERREDPRILALLTLAREVWQVD